MVPQNRNVSFFQSPSSHINRTGCSGKCGDKIVKHVGCGLVSGTILRRYLEGVVGFSRQSPVRTAGCRAAHTKFAHLVALAQIRRPLRLDHGDLDWKQTDTMCGLHEAKVIKKSPRGPHEHNIHGRVVQRPITLIHYNYSYQFQVYAWSCEW